MAKMFDSLAAKLIDYAPTLLIAIAVLAVGAVVMHVFLVLLSRGLKRSKSDKIVVTFVVNVSRVVLWILLATIVLALLGIPTSSIIAVIGTGGVAAGLAMKDSLSNLAGGFILLLQKPFHAGDVIQTGEFRGTVLELNIVYTELRDEDGAKIYIPNGELAKATIINHSYKPTDKKA